MESKYGKKYLIYLYLLLGALAAFPPLVTDMYLPALPVMTAEFNTVPSAVYWDWPSVSLFLDRSVINGVGSRFLNVRCCYSYWQR